MVVGSSVSSSEVSSSSSVSLLSSFVDGSSSLTVSGDVSSSVGAGGGVVVSGTSGSLPGLDLGNPGRGGLFLVIRFGRGRLVGRERESDEDGALVVVEVVELVEEDCDLDLLDWNLLGEAEVNRDLEVVVEAVVDSGALLSSVASGVLRDPGRGRLLPTAGRGRIRLPWKDLLVGAVVVVVVVLEVDEVDLLVA